MGWVAKLEGFNRDIRRKVKKGDYEWDELWFSRADVLWKSFYCSQWLCRERSFGSMEIFLP